MNNAMDSKAVTAMASRLGLRRGVNDKGMQVFRYSSPSGFGMEFTVPWLKDDGYYERLQVENQLRAMLDSAKMDEKVYNYLKNEGNVKKINDACLSYGMRYDESDRRFYYVVDGKALFGVDHDYIASLICTGKATEDHLKDLLDTFKETAEFERGKTVEASGKFLLHKRKKKNGNKKKQNTRKNRR